MSERHPAVVKADPRMAVLRQLTLAYERHAEAEQLLVEAGQYDAAALSHETAVRLARAIAAEGSNPEPKED